jgi:hypothetical protein
MSLFTTKSKVLEKLEVPSKALTFIKASYACLAFVISEFALNFVSIALTLST